jgi:hypothetical protein
MCLPFGGITGNLEGCVRIADDTTTKAVHPQHSDFAKLSRRLN